MADDERSSLGDEVLAAKWAERHGEGGEGFAALIGLMRTHQLTIVNVDAVLKRQGLTRNAFLVLLVVSLSEEGPLSLGRIGKRIVVNPTTITAVVDQLERAGLVARSPHPTDRRTILVELTPAGDAALGSASLALRDAGFGFASIAPERVWALTHALRLMIADDGGDADL